METKINIDQTIEALAGLLKADTPQSGPSERQLAFLMAMARIKMDTWNGITEHDMGTFRHKFDNPRREAAAVAGITAVELSRWGNDEAFKENYQKTVWLIDDAIMCRLYGGVKNEELAAILAILEIKGF